MHDVGVWCCVSAFSHLLRYVCPVLQPEQPQQCSPAAARNAVRQHADRTVQLDRQQQLVPLLAYCLRDLDLSSGPTGSWLQQLLGLRLLPLADGSSLTAFEASVRTAAAHQLVFVVTDALEHSLVHSQRECWFPGPFWLPVPSLAGASCKHVIQRR